MAPSGLYARLCHAFLVVVFVVVIVDIYAQAASTVATHGEWQCKTARSSEWAQHFSNASCLV